MPRLNLVDPETATGKAKEIFDGPLKEKRLNIFKGIANNPEVLEAFLQFSGGVKKGGALTAAEHELVALAIGEKRNCDYCLAAHTKVAGGLGIDADAAVAARKGEGDTPKHTALIRFTNAMLEKEGFVSDTELQAFRDAGYDDAAVVEVVGAIAVNTFTNYFNHVNDTEIDSVFTPAPSL